MDGRPPPEDPASMTHHHEDPRVISLESEHYNARLMRREDQTSDLATFWVRYEGEPVPFEPGQYMTIGVYVDGKLVQRPYSVASAPAVAGEEGYEFYVRLLPVMRFTTLICRLPVPPRGPDDAPPPLFASPGPGIAPFISMTRQLLAAGKPRRTVVLHGASYADE